MIFPVKQQTARNRNLEKPYPKRIAANFPLPIPVPSEAFCQHLARFANRKQGSTAVFLSEPDGKSSEPNRSEPEAKGKGKKANGKTE